MIVQPLVTRQQMHGRGHLNRDKRDGTAARLRGLRLQSSAVII